MNPHADAARTRKACALADMLDAFDCDPDDAETFDMRTRLDVAEAAGVRTPSDESWSMAVRMLRGRIDMRALVAKSGGDPFVGLS